MNINSLPLSAMSLDFTESGTTVLIAILKNSYIYFSRNRSTFLLNNFLIQIQSVINSTIHIKTTKPFRITERYE